MKITTLSYVFALLASPAFAGEGGVTFDQIKEACQNPGKYQNQLAPANLQISCEEHVTRWMPFAAKEMQLPRSRYIVASLASNKYQVAPSTHTMNVDMQSAQCPAFKEVIEVSTFTKDTSCEEILAWKSGEEELCADILDRARQANPNLVQSKETGRVVELCSESSQNQGKGKGQDQGQDQGQKK